MNYRLEIKEEARQQLRALSKAQRHAIGKRLDLLQDDLKGDVKKLSGKADEYRPGVGRYRILFMLESDLIRVYAVRHRQGLMSRTAQKPRKKPFSLQSLQREVKQLRERVEDLEDLYELREAVKRNAGKPGIRWEKVKAELGMD